MQRAGRYRRYGRGWRENLQYFDDFDVCCRSGRREVLPNTEAVTVSSSSGAADVVEQMGANLNLTPEQVAQSIRQTSIGFMFAPNHHSAMRHVAPVRRSLGFRSIFNILGPLTNPAGALNQLLGVFHT